MKKKGFTLIELLVVIAIIAMLLAILMPALNKVKKIAQRVVCGTNLKGLGTAQVVYANDYEDMYAQQRYQGHTIADRTAGFQDVAKDWNVGASLSVGASLYLLVREADVSPKSFICPSSAETAYDGKNNFNLDITELWDFGHPGFDASTGPANCQSYSYHNPYSRFAPDGTRSAAFAVMADKNPWFDSKLIVGGANSDNFMDHSGPQGDDWTTAVTLEKWMTARANAQPHSRDGQNVMFGDGHNAFEKRSDVGVRHDNIYTPQPANPSTPNHIRQGSFPPIQTYPTNDPSTSSDSFLINDTRGG